MSSKKNKVLIGVSSCLLGNKVRYDGNHQYSAAINQLPKETFKLIAFCPEVEIGLGVPRPKIQLVEKNGDIYCFDEATLSIDYTRQLINSCDSQMSWISKLSGYIFKTKSPSCGITKVKTHFKERIEPTGRGIFAKRLIETFPNLPFIEEDQFETPHLRKQFILDAISYNQLNFIKNK
ncbi:DUF523 domain-containing protein [Aliikangiella sp. IMCC44359]|uniref:DUF523 domain-containing protein n=1 Tax=Aliikangiella sp. IMCC44359 TaxID=3459125 RepID=UPI00403AF57B